MGKGDFIQLIQYDKDLERVKLEKKSEWFERILTSQIGLRWVVEAICPNIDPVLPNEHGHPNSTGDLAAVTSWTYPHMDMTQEQIATQTNMHIALVQELSHKQPTLVGHVRLLRVKILSSFSFIGLKFVIFLPCKEFINQG